MITEVKPQFISKIIDGTKIHTIRTDKFDLYKPGTEISFVTKSVGIDPDLIHFKEAVCTGVQKIKIRWYNPSSEKHWPRTRVLIPSVNSVSILTRILPGKLYIGQNFHIKKGDVWTNKYCLWSLERS